MLYFEFTKLTLSRTRIRDWSRHPAEDHVLQALVYDWDYHTQNTHSTGQQLEAHGRLVCLSLAFS